MTLLSPNTHQRSLTTRELATVLYCSLMDASLSPVDDNQLTNSLQCSDTAEIEFG
jgi:hypothetical protein